MITIQEAVENELNKHPIHSKLLTEDMINATSFARLIESSLRKNLLKDISIATIVTCLGRAKKNLKPKEFPKINEVSVVYPLVWKSFENLSLDQKEELLEQLPTLHSYYENEESIVLTHKDVGNIYNLGFDYQTITGICELTLEYDPVYQLESGLFYNLSKELYWRDITIVDFNTSQNKIWIYVLIKDLTETLEIIRTKFIKIKKN